MSIPVRIMATAAVWAVFVVIGTRLRHPVVWATLVALGVSISLLIWSNPPPKN
jgi:hypothetical protein